MAGLSHFTTIGLISEPHHQNTHTQHFLQLCARQFFVLIFVLLCKVFCLFVYLFLSVFSRRLQQFYVHPRINICIYRHTHTREQTHGEEPRSGGVFGWRWRQERSGRVCCLWVYSVIALWACLCITFLVWLWALHLTGAGTPSTSSWLLTLPSLFAHHYSLLRALVSPVNISKGTATCTHHRLRGLLRVKLSF